MSKYDDTLEWLFSQTVQFTKVGASAYKPGLHTIKALCNAFGSPHTALRCIHVAGTNGKGSTASMLAAVLQCAGLKTALYTSPHIVDFRERMRINGEMIPKDRVEGFIDRYQAMDLKLSPSFFELTTAMAFDWFASEKVDIAVIEAGLGGRLDSTNIITPVVSVITNISLDHTDILGDTLEKIAGEKAGIIKSGVPVVVGPEQQPEVIDVFRRKSATVAAPLEQAEIGLTQGYEWALRGAFQRLNVATVLAALRHIPEVDDATISRGLLEVEALTGLKGRLTTVQLPSGQTLIYDTGHNPGAWRWLADELSNISPLSVVLGFVADKDVESIVDMLPDHAYYFFTQPDSHRALPAGEFYSMAARRGLKGEAIESPTEAIAAALAAGRTVFVGGSNYLVGEIWNFAAK